MVCPVREIPLKISMTSYVELRKATLTERPITKTTLREKSKIGGLTGLIHYGDCSGMCLPDSRHIDRCNGAESLEGNPRVHRPLIFNKAAKNVHWAKDSLQRMMLWKSGTHIEESERESNCKTRNCCRKIQKWFLGTLKQEGIIFFLKIHSKTKANKHRTKAKIDKWDDMKLKSLYHNKRNDQLNEEKTLEVRESIFKLCIWWWLVPRIFKE